MKTIIAKLRELPIRKLIIVLVIFVWFAITIALALFSFVAYKSQYDLMSRTIILEHHLKDLETEHKTTDDVAEKRLQMLERYVFVQIPEMVSNQPGQPPPQPRPVLTGWEVWFKNWQKEYDRRLDTLERWRLAHEAQHREDR